MAVVFQIEGSTPVKLRPGNTLFPMNKENQSVGSLLVTDDGVRFTDRTGAVMDYFVMKDDDNFERKFGTTPIRVYFTDPTL